MKRNLSLCGVWEDCFLFLNPLNTYREFKKVFDFPVISDLIGLILSIYLTLKCAFAICCFAPFMGVNMLLKP